MLLELRAIDLADADRDENAHKCDRCERRGVMLFDGFWLCHVCWQRAERRVMRIG